jgi:ubiquinone/menaquinone biosynthesis C-methylase UbiE
VFVPKEIAQNLVMGFPTVRRIAQRHHQTGLQGRDGGAEEVFGRLLSVLPFPIDGRRVLELGPGTGPGLAKLARRAGASCALFDTRSYLDTAALADIGIEYVVRADGRLPWPDDWFDVVWSWSVLEHVADPVSTLADSFRVLRRGGSFIALVDLESHMGGRNEPDRMFEFLKYPGWLWNLMTSNRSSYLNRLRRSDWRRLLAETGFVEIAEDPVLARCDPQDLRRIRYLVPLSEEDRTTRRVLIRGSVPGGDAA